MYLLALSEATICLVYQVASLHFWPCFLASAMFAKLTTGLLLPLLRWLHTDNWCITATYCSGVCIRQFAYNLNLFTHKHQPTHTYPYTLTYIMSDEKSLNSLKILTIPYSLLPMLNRTTSHMCR